MRTFKYVENLESTNPIVNVLAQGVRRKRTPRWSAQSPAMRQIPHWTKAKTIPVAESKGGVLVTVHPDDNLVASVKPWPAPELLQKYYASSRFEGRTPGDAIAARSALGHYSDVQSLNSEDAVTWSFFGNLAYAPAEERLRVLNRILETIGARTIDDSPVCWLWRRIPHPEKPESNGGPEIDFAFLSHSTLVLGEAKWSSSIGEGQGKDKNSNQLVLRAMYCNDYAKKAIPTVRDLIILGVGRTATVFDGYDAGLTTCASLRQLSWEQVSECFEIPAAARLRDYLAWKSQYSRNAPNPSLEPTAAGCTPFAARLTADDTE